MVLAHRTALFFVLGPRPQLLLLWLGRPDHHYVLLWLSALIRRTCCRSYGGIWLRLLLLQLRRYSNCYSDLPLLFLLMLLLVLQLLLKLLRYIILLTALATGIAYLL